MFRTRDFVILFILIVALLGAIVVTLVKQYTEVPTAVATSFFAAGVGSDQVATVASSVTVSREDNLRALRSKIAEADMSMTITPEVEADETVVERVEEEEAIAVALVTCANYQPARSTWSPQGVRFEVAEGARVVYREVPRIVGTTTTLTREVLAQLPALPLQTGEHCLSSDVIGIAQDGSLIRNDEVGLYSVFGEHTLIGYALDGFPIYGTSGQTTDSCGGTAVSGEYRYYLSEERETILNCFAATPTTL